MSAKPDPAPKSWREVYPPHPAADVFPMLPENELRDLGLDIAKNGLQVPILLWSPNRDKSPPFYVLDGRNRLDAMELVGLPTTREKPYGGSLAGGLKTKPWKLDISIPREVVHEDPIPYVISANIMRRHLTPQERVLLVAKALASEPVPTTDRKDLSDRSIQGEDGKLQGSTKGHVAKVAEAARVSKPTARKHLEIAAESGELTPEEAGVEPKPPAAEIVADVDDQLHALVHDYNATDAEIEALHRKQEEIGLKLAPLLYEWAKAEKLTGRSLLSGDLRTDYKKVRAGTGLKASAANIRWMIHCVDQEEGKRSLDEIARTMPDEEWDGYMENFCTTTPEGQRTKDYLLDARAKREGAS